MKHLEPCIMCGKSKAHVVYSGLKVRGVIRDNQHGQMDEGDET